MTAEIRCPAKACIIEAQYAFRAHFFARVPAEHTPEQVQLPNYFELMSQGQYALRAGDIIEVEPEHALWGLSLRVMVVDPDAMRVITRLRGEVEHYDVKISVADEKAGYKLKHRGAAAKWSILQGDHVVKQGFDSKAAAAEALANL